MDKSNIVIHEQQKESVLTRGFEVLAAENGGWIIKSGNYYPGEQRPVIGAFTNTKDMMDFIQKDLNPETTYKAKWYDGPVKIDWKDPLVKYTVR